MHKEQVIQKMRYTAPFGRFDINTNPSGDKKENLQILLK